MIALMAIVTPLAAIAVQPDEILADPALEERAREIGEGLRCVVCQNQSIDDSDAPLARDLRLLVRERLTAGDSDDQVIEHVTARYGDYVLLKPRMSGFNVLLWLSPFVFMAAATGVAIAFMRRKDKDPKPQPLSAEESAAVEEMTK